MNRLFLFLGLPVFILNAATANSAEQPFADFIIELKNEVAAKGLNPQLLTDALGDNPQPIERVYKKMSNQPEVKFSFTRYTSSLASDKRAETGRKQLASHQQYLNSAAQTYGIPAEVITALWGIESHYGELPGKFPIIPSLVTLVYDSHRKEFFKKELFHALRIAQDGHIEVTSMTGSWAGAMGQCQFMPSSFTDYAADGNGDGKKDIWSTPADVFASAANYLKSRGWQSGEPGMQRVVLGKKLPKMSISAKGLSDLQPISYWEDLGIYSVQKNTLPANKTTTARLFLPQGPSKQAFLVYNNFEVIMRWNNSSYFAYSVLKLADKIANKDV